jgi:hypothetical protein
MLEPWASESQQEALAITCYKNNKKYHCDDCDNCPINIKFLHTPSTEKRELVYTMATVVGERHKGVGKSIAAILLFFIIVAYLVWAGIPAHGQTTYPELQRMVSDLYPVDVNGDGQITCVDYSVALYRRNPAVFELVYMSLADWDGSDSHMTVMFKHPTKGWTLIEAQGKKDINFYANWGVWPRYVWIVTDMWLNGNVNWNEARNDTERRYRIIP